MRNLARRRVARTIFWHKTLARRARIVASHIRSAIARVAALPAAHAAPLLPHHRHLIDICLAGPRIVRHALSGNAAPNMKASGVVMTRRLIITARATATQTGIERIK